MKIIYCIEAFDSDPCCSNRSVEVLHTTNKGFLDDLVYKLNRINKSEDDPSLYVKEILPKPSLTKKDIEEGKMVLKSFGVRLYD